MDEAGELPTSWISEVEALGVLGVAPEMEDLTAHEVATPTTRTINSIGTIRDIEMLPSAHAHDVERERICCLAHGGDATCGMNVHLPVAAIRLLPWNPVMCRQSLRPSV